MASGPYLDSGYRAIGGPKAFSWLTIGRLALDSYCICCVEVEEVELSSHLEIFPYLRYLTLGKIVSLRYLSTVSVR